MKRGITKLGIFPFVFSIGSIAFAAPAQAQPVSRPGAEYQTIAEDGAWCWFADPRAAHQQGTLSRTYIGFVNRSGDIKIIAHDTATKQVESYTLRKGLNKDDHASPALLVRLDGRLQVFYSAHGGRKMFYRISENPEDISSWGREQELKSNTPGDYGYTYPNPIQLSGEAGKIYLFWRGGNFKPTFATSEKGRSWSEAQTLIQGPGARPYVKVVSNGTDTIHFAFTDGHPRVEKNNSIYYLRYHDGAFTKANGERIKKIESLPLAPMEAKKIYDAKSHGAKAWIWDIALNEDEQPVIVYATFPKKTDHRYRYARYNGSEWIDNDIVAAGGYFPQTPAGKVETEPNYSGGVVLDHNDPSVVYLSRRVKAVFEIERWKTDDGGRTWKSQPITTASTKNNLRPVVVRDHVPGGIRLVWMYGDYIHYTNYSTSLKVLLNEQ